jgi:hypothetical protein
MLGAAESAESERFHGKCLRCDKEPDQATMKWLVNMPHFPRLVSPSIKFIESANSDLRVCA